MMKNLIERTKSNNLDENENSKKKVFFFITIFKETKPGNASHIFKNN